MSGPVGVFGIGNVLLGDDAIGPSVARWLEARFEFPPDVVVEDLGTPGLEMPTHLAGHRTIILIDAVAGTEEPGTIKRYDREAILRHAPGIRLSPHDPALKETLLMLELTGQGPGEVRLVGVVPGNTNMGVGLTDPVRDSIEPAALAVLEELARIGVEAVPREGSPAAHLWWDA